jgi:hypothetical protein
MVHDSLLARARSCARDRRAAAFLREFVPHARRIAVLGNPTTISTCPQLASARAGTTLELLPLEAGSRDELGRPLDAIALSSRARSHCEAAQTLAAGAFIQNESGLAQGPAGASGAS